MATSPLAPEIGSDEDIKRLELIGVIGFNGYVPKGLCFHPDRQHIIYPLGSTVVVEDIETTEQSFLHGHSNEVSCIQISKSGRLVVSGQNTHMGYKADIIVWEFTTMTEYARFTLHKVKVQAIGISPSETFLASLGGPDDGNVVVWSLPNKVAICGNPAQPITAGFTECLEFFNTNDTKFVTGGEGSLRIWSLDADKRKVRATEVNLASVKRIIKCIAIAPDDHIFYCGTSSGDLLVINTQSHLLQFISTPKTRFSLGVTAISVLTTVPDCQFFVGTGDGLIVHIRMIDADELPSSHKKLVNRFINMKSTKVTGAVTSIALRGSGHQFFVGTNRSHIYDCVVSNFSTQLISTSHNSAIKDLKFPYGCSDLIVTGAFEEVSVFHTSSHKQLLNITIPNMVCHTLDIYKDGSAIVTGWSDSRIRAFYPETGEIMFTIENAHKMGVTAIAVTTKVNMIVSGGGEGQVRVWRIRELPRNHRRDLPFSHRRKPDPHEIKREHEYISEMLTSMKEHTNAVTSIQVSKEDKECISSCCDGTCIIPSFMLWHSIPSLYRSFCRKQILFANTLFHCICYRPDECQVITGGTDRKVAFWELYDGQLIREVEASRSGAIYGMDMIADGSKFVTVGDDKLVKLWTYNECDVTHVGIGHGGPITGVKVCPRMRVIVSYSSDGAVYIWRYPK